MYLSFGEESGGGREREGEDWGAWSEGILLFEEMHIRVIDEILNYGTVFVLFGGIV